MPLHQKGTVDCEGQVAAMGEHAERQRASGGSKGGPPGLPSRKQLPTMGLLDQFRRFRQEVQEEAEWRSSSLFAEGFCTPARRSHASQSAEPDASEYVKWSQVRAVANSLQRRRLQGAANHARQCAASVCSGAGLSPSPRPPRAAAAGGVPLSTILLPLAPLLCRFRPSCRWPSRRSKCAAPPMRHSHSSWPAPRARRSGCGGARLVLRLAEQQCRSALCGPARAQGAAWGGSLHCSVYAAVTVSQASRPAPTAPMPTCGSP